MDKPDKNAPTPEKHLHDTTENVNSFNIPDTQHLPGKNDTGINNPNIELPAFNPPVPNRAWTAMRAGVDIDSLTEAEKADLYIGRDNIL